MKRTSPCRDGHPRLSAKSRLILPNLPLFRRTGESACPYIEALHPTEQVTCLHVNSLTCLLKKTTTINQDNGKINCK